MTFAVKIGLATLSGGAVAVGGHETYAIATGKPGWIVSSSQPKENTTEQTQESNPIVDQENQNLHPKRTELLTLVEDLKTRCTIKIKPVSNETEKDIDNNIVEDEAGKLLTKINEIKDNRCGTGVSGQQFLFIKKDNNSWEISLTDKQKIEDWIKKTDKFKNDQCLLKIYSSDRNHQDFKTYNGDLSKLPEFLEGQEVINDCNSITNQENKDVIVQKTESEWSVYPTNKNSES